MSRLGKTPVSLPKGVEVKASPSGKLEVKGPKGSLHLQLPNGLKLTIEDAAISIERDEKVCGDSATHGLYRSLVKNAIVGVCEGYSVELTLIGVGYRANVQGDKLDLQVGFSHPTAVAIPKELKVAVDKGTSIIIQGIDKQIVGQFAADVRAVKPPEPYKGKGIRYKDEYVRKKEGKAAKGKA
ncbi:MAG TPA: 50S ribosomal protein L6 [Chlamydiales bacterium]|nr:50S ribosomal protein L6 [Chlamydiales bacterium]